MNRLKNVAIICFAALVAGTAALVYARDGAQNPAPHLIREAASQLSNDKLPDPPSASDKAAKQGAAGPSVLYDPHKLPEPVQRMLSEIILTAQTGNVDAMRPVLESNELKPMVAAAHVNDPIQYWKEQSIDGTGRDVLAAMLNMIASGALLTGKGHDAMYVWPYFAEMDLGKLTPEQEVEFYRAVPPDLAASMKKTGKYAYYRLGISPSGVWHYFIR